MPPKDQLRGVEKEAKFYADENVDHSIVIVLRWWRRDVVTAQDIGATGQPDEYHYKYAFRAKRVLLTQDRDFLDNKRFPLAQTRGVVLFDVDSSSVSALSSAVRVVDGILAGLAPILNESKLVVNAEQTVTRISRHYSNGEWEEKKERYRFHDNGQDLWVWEDD